MTKAEEILEKHWGEIPASTAISRSLISVILTAMEEYSGLKVGDKQEIAGKAFDSGFLRGFQIAEWSKNGGVSDKDALFPNREQYLKSIK